MRLFVMVMVFIVLFSIQVSAINVAVTPRTIAVPLGEERDIKVTINETTGFSLSIDTANGYGPARISNINPANVDFSIQHSNTLISVSNLTPDKSVDIYVTVAANAGNDEKNIIMYISEIGSQREEVDVVVSEPVAFSGLDGFWMVILILFSGAVYWKMKI